MGIGSLLLMCSYAGLVIFAFYDIQGCDPIKAKLVEKPDQLFPLFVMQVMGDIPAIPGLFVAGVFSGALSTVRWFSDGICKYKPGYKSHDLL